MLVRIDWFGPEAFLVQSAASAGPALRGWLAAEGLATAHAVDVEALRIEGRYPAARDIPPKTLPQELGRTAQAISFTKGCYLGQETVARIDALGHVNRALALVAIDGPPPPPPAELTCDGEPAGTITSSCAAPRLGGAACLAIVHRRGLAAGVDLRVLDRAARIVEAAPHAAENQEGPR
jgi:folate-binding protein YgfZ